MQKMAKNWRGKNEESVGWKHSADKKSKLKQAEWSELIYNMHLCQA